MNITTASFPRHHGLGGSDIAAAFGLSPFKTPVQLWAEKRRLTPPTSSVDARHLRLGHHLEPFIAQEFERETGLQTHSHPHTLTHPDYPMFYGHIDRFVTERGAPLYDAAGRVCATTLLECKSAHAFAHTQWGEAGSDQMPAAYLLQVVWYLAITGCERAIVAVLLGNQRFARYEVLRDKALEGLVLTRAKRFWDEHVVAGLAPDPTHTEDLRLLYPKAQANLHLEADEGLHAALERYRSLQASMSAQHDEAEAIKQRILATMGSAETLQYRGAVLATWKQARGTQRVDLAALEAAHPDVVARFKHEQPGSRRFLVKAPPKQAQAQAPTQAPTQAQAPTHPPTQAPTQKPPQKPLEKAQGALPSDAAKRGEHPPPGTPRSAHPRTAHECTAHEVAA